MANAPCICICVESAREDLDAIWAAMGRGPVTFERKLCSINEQNPTDQTPPTHRVMQDMSATDELVAQWAAMAQNNDLPSLPADVVWGENGVISAQDAQAAIANGNLFVFPAYGLETEQDELNWQAGAIAGMQLRFVPDPEF